MMNPGKHMYCVHLQATLQLSPYEQSFRTHLLLEGQLLESVRRGRSFGIAFDDNLDFVLHVSGAALKPSPS
jgi:hypothetical protein